MGNFYTNFVAQGAEQQAVVDVVREAQRTAFVSPTQNGKTIIFDQASDEQDPEVIVRFGEHLSGGLNCAVLAVLNHDDSVLCYWLFEGGRVVDEYNSAPGYFDPAGGDSPPAGGDAGKLCAAFNPGGDAGPLAAVLHKSDFEDDGYAFALERHEALARILNLPLGSVGFGYRYIEEGESPPGLEGELTQLG